MTDPKDQDAAPNTPDALPPAPPAPPTSPDGAPKPNQGIPIAATVTLLIVLLIAGGALVGTLELGAAMGIGDSCTFGPKALQCVKGEVSYAAYNAFLALPPLGLLISLALGTTGSIIAIRRGRTGLRWAGMAWSTFALAMIADFVLSALTNL